jgi:hypothetical protein
MVNEKKINRLYLPWDRMRVNYNEKKGTTYPSVKKWVKAVYKKNTYVLLWAAADLEVSTTAFRKILKVTGVTKPEKRKR